MKTRIAFLLLLIVVLVVAVQAQTTFRLFHQLGPYSAPHTNDLLPSVVDLPDGASYATFRFSRIDPFAGGSNLNGLDVPLLANITGSTSSQSINVATTIGMPGPSSQYSYLIIDGGLSTQEVLQIQSIDDSTHLHAIVNLNHTAGAKIRRIFSTFSKYKVPIFTALPMLGVSNFGFINYAALPDGVFDQYRYGTCASTASVEDDEIPWYSNSGGIHYPTTPMYSSGSLSMTGNPTNAVALDAGPITTAPAYEPCVQVQLLFTITPEPTLFSLDYRYYWDRN